MNEDLAKCHQCGRQSPGIWTQARAPAWLPARTSSHKALSLKCALAIQKWGIRTTSPLMIGPTCPHTFTSSVSHSPK